MKAFLKYYIKDNLVLLQQKWRLSRSKQTPILILTMAKVGSLSVYSSIKKYSKIPVFHIHSLDEAEVKAGDKFCFDNGIYPNSRSPIFLLNKYLIKPKKQYQVISLFRNPIERNISAFFDAFKLHTGVSPQNYKGTIDQLIATYHDALDHEYATTWFEKQFFEGTGIDVYKTPFDPEKGFVSTTIGTADCLIINVTLEDDFKEQLISDFCNINGFALHNENITAASKAAALYKQFKDTITFDREYLERQLESKYVHHFFSKTERDRLYTKWSS